MREKKEQKAIGKYRGEIVLFASIILAAFLMKVYLDLYNKNPAAWAVVTVNGEETGRYALSADTREEIKGWQGGTNTLVIQDGCAWVEHASCPDKICEKQGKISKSGETVTCLPNRVMVTVVGDDPALDGIVK